MTIDQSGMEVHRDELLDGFLLNNQNRAALKITLEQLRLLYFLKREGSLAGVAKALQKDQSSIKRSLDALEDHLSSIVKSQLYARESGRGRNPLTAAGLAAETLAVDVLAGLRRFADGYTPKGEFVVHLGLTTFLLNFVRTLLLQLQNEDHFVTRLLHVRTGNLEDKVLSRDVQCAFGGKTVRRGDPVVFKDGVVAREIQRDSFGFMTNFDPRLTTPSIGQIIKAKIPLILPRTGVIFDFITAELSIRANKPIKTHKEVEEEIYVVEWCDDVHFAFELMRLEMRRAGMFVLKGVYPHYENFQNPDNTQRPEAKFFELSDCHYETVICFLTNKDEMFGLSGDHPLKHFLDLANEWIDARENSMA